MSVVVIRMQDLASEFSIIFPGLYPRTPQAGGVTASRIHPSPAGRRAPPRCWDSKLGPPQLFSRGCTPAPSWAQGPSPGRVRRRFQKLIPLSQDANAICIYLVVKAVHQFKDNTVCQRRRLQPDTKNCFI